MQKGQWDAAFTSSYTFVHFYGILRSASIVWLACGESWNVWKRSRETRMADISKFVDKAYEGMELAEIADSPVDALQGVSAGDAEALQKALGIKTVRQLAENKYVLWAQAITTLSGKK